MAGSFLNLSAYRFVNLDALDGLRQRIGDRAAAAGLRGTVLLAEEGINLFVAGEPPAARAWLAGLGDRHVGAALALVHGRPGEHWTVERLARQVGLSRSALADRFSFVVGEPIIGFLTRVRLQLAAHELATTGHAIEAVATGAGYEAVNSFSRAFKRAYGKPPSKWRRGTRRRR